MEVPVNNLSEIGPLLALVIGMPPETNPAFMKEYIEALGVPNYVDVVDMERLGPENLANPPKSIISVICVFSDDKGVIKLRESRGQSKCDECARAPLDLFFMKYGLKRMSGTVAVIHSIANNLDQVHVTSGALKNFLDSVVTKTPDERGQCLEKNEEIVDIRRCVRRQFTDSYVSSEYSELASLPDEMLPGWQSMHSTPCILPEESQRRFRDPEPVHKDNRPSEGEDELSFKFISFVSVKGHLLEFDGSTDGPYCHGKCTPDNVLPNAANIIKQYANADPEANQYQAMLISVDSS